MAVAATAGVQSSDHQYSNLTVNGRSEGGNQGESPAKGNGISHRGNTGGEGAAKRCAGPVRPSVGAIRGEPTTRAGAPFAPCTTRWTARSLGVFPQATGPMRVEPGWRAAHGGAEMQQNG